MEKQRIYYWDNLKALLIFLVVLGHFLLPVTDVSKIIEIPNTFIYRFHMPAFVFVSGYFAKSYVNKKEGRINKLAGFIILYGVYKILLWITESAVLGEVTELNFLLVRAAPWYMICMFYWYLVLPLFSRFKPVISIGFAVLLLIIVGHGCTFEYVLGVARGIIYLPFFLMGFYFKKEWVEIITSKKVKIIVGISVGFVIAASLAGQIFFDISFINVLENYTRNAIDTVLMADRGATVIWMAKACVISFIIMCFIPKGETVFTFIGSRTLGIYILHRIVRQVFENGNLYRYFDDNEIVLLLVCIAISVVVTLVCSVKCFTILFQKTFEINFGKLLIKKQK